MDVSGAVELYANRFARNIAPIRITGNYGSEILRSNVAFRPRILDTSLLTPEFRELTNIAVETYRNEANCHRLSFIAFKQVPWHHFGRFSIEKSQLTPRSPFLDNDLVALAYRIPPSLTFSAQPILRAIGRGNPDLEGVQTDRCLTIKPPSFAEKCAHSWQDFTAKAEYAYDYGMPQWLVPIDRVLKPLCPEKLFLGRHKFYHFRVWYRDQLSSVLENRLDFTSEPSCYVSGASKQMIREHTAGRFNYTLELHRLLTVQLVERLFIR